MATSISYLPEAVDLECYAGDGASLQLNAGDGNGNVVSLEGDIVAQVRRNRSDADPLLVFKVDMSKAEEGIVIIWLSGKDTASLIDGDEPFKGVWDAQWTAVNSEPKTLVQGNLTCIPDVTR